MLHPWRPINVGTHSGEKPHSCKQCLKWFSLSQHLEKKISHTRKKPFSCKECLKTFSYASSMKTNVRTHTGGKTYKA